MKRIIIGPCRSGTTMLLRALENNPDILIDQFQNIKNGQRTNGHPDYSFFSRTVPHGKVLVGKETIGYGNLEDCTLKVFSELEFQKLVKKTRPLFCFRHPVATYNSWLENGLVEPGAGPDLFITAYKWSSELYHLAKKVCEDVHTCIYEQLCESPENVLLGICERWGITFDPNMLDWKDTPSKISFDTKGIQSGHYSRVTSSQTIERETKRTLKVSREHLRILQNSGVLGIYRNISQDIT